MKKRVCCTNVGPSGHRERGEVFSSSIKALLRTNRKYEGGMCDVQMRVIISREQTKWSLGFRWPIQYWDVEAGFCKPRYKNDTQANDHNMEIRAAVGKANDILLHYRLSHRVLTIEIFKKEYLNYFNRQNFLDFMAKQIEVRRAELAPGTYQKRKKPARAGSAKGFKKSPTSRSGSPTNTNHQGRYDKPFLVFHRKYFSKSTLNTS